MYVKEPSPAPYRGGALLLLHLSGIVVTGLVCMAVAEVNGRILHGWQGFPNGRQGEADCAALVGGMFCGVFLSGIFMPSTAIITDGRCTYGFAFRHLLLVVAGTLVGYLIGGVLGHALSANYPECSWVLGSAYGGILGALISLPLSLILLYVNWQKHLARSIRFVLDPTPEPPVALEPPPRAGIVPRQQTYRESPRREAE
jgi:hypothetical protein